MRPRTGQTVGSNVIKICLATTLIIAVQCILATYIVTKSSRTAIWVTSSASDLQSHSNNQKSCAIVQLMNYHYDVAAGFTWTFQQAGCSTVDLYLDQDTLGIQPILQPWFSGKVYLHKDTLNTTFYTKTYDVVMYTTFPEGHIDHLYATLQHSPPHTRFILVVHNPDKLLYMLSRGLLDHINKNRVGIITLGPWTHRYMATASKELQMEWMMPLMPMEFLNPNKAPNSICIQGSISQQRRDFQTVFQAASEPRFLSSLKDNNQQLLLIGSKGLGYDQVMDSIPSSLRDHIVHLKNLRYLEFYQTVASQCAALLTALPANSDYLTKKASSTLAVALNLGIPLIITSEEYTAYEYLLKETTFVYNTTAVLTDAMLAALRHGHSSVMQQSLDELRMNMMNRNVKIAHDLMYQPLL